MQLPRVSLPTRTPLFALAVAMLIVPLATQAWAEVADVELKKLVGFSDLIVVATVTRVEAGPDELNPRDEGFPPVKVATARVVETWKGKAEENVRFVASPTWTCDISSAKEGEKIVLFLKRRKDLPIMDIAHSGRGRMRLRDVEDRPYAIIPEGVILPPGTRTIAEKKEVKMSMPGPGNEAGKKSTLTFTYEEKSIALEALRDLVIRKGP